MAIKIERVEEGSEAQALGLQPGDELLSVDDNELNDTLDYDFYTDSRSFHLKAKVADGIREWDVSREERGPFGCDFHTYLGDEKHSCSNHCMFCFIDQLPPGMRESLYFKDDDERLSFLFGNYITMTNMQDHEIDRIIKMHISPINISVHTTNPQLRVRMLANRRGGEVLQYLPRLVQGGIAINCQLVPVCPEQLGGLPTPREPAERTEGGVVTKTGADVSAQFQRGAEQALHLARIFGCKKAVLKERSPSCGAGEIYDGSFTGARVPGDGVTAQLLKANGIAVFGESEIETLLEQLDEAQEEAPSFF